MAHSRHTRRGRFGPRKERQWQVFSLNAAFGSTGAGVLNTVELIAGTANEVITVARIVGSMFTQPLFPLISSELSFVGIYKTNVDTAGVRITRNPLDASDIENGDWLWWAARPYVANGAAAAATSLSPPCPSCYNVDIKVMRKLKEGESLQAVSITPVIDTLHAFNLRGLVLHS